MRNSIGFLNLNRSNRIVVLSSLLVFLISSLVLIGWQFNILVLKSVVPGFITMKVNTALGMALLACTNLIFRSQAQTSRSKLTSSLGLSLSLLAILIGIGTLIEYRFDINLGIDELFYPDPSLIPGRFPPGRLAPITGTLFILLGLAQIFIFNPFHNFFKTAQVLSLLGLVIAFQALIGYFFGVSYSFGLAFYTQMAVHTTVLAIAVCAGILASRPNEGWLRITLSDTAGGLMARNLLIWAVLVPPFVLYLELAGVRLGLYHQDFSAVVRVSGSMIFFVLMVLKTAAELHASDIRKKESEEKFKTVTELSPQIIWTANPDGFLDYYNERWFIYTGMTFEQTQGWGWAPVIHPDDLQKCIDRWKLSYETGVPYEIEYRFKRASDNQYRWHLGRALPSRDRHGKITKWFGTATDIDDQKKSEEQKARIAADLQAASLVQISEARLRAIFDAAFDAIVGMDSEGLVSDWNPRAEQMFGWTREEVMGKRMSELVIFHEVRETHEEGIKHFLHSGHGPIMNQTIEVEALRKSGEIFPIQLSVTSIRVNDSFLFTAFIADITERKKTQADLISAREIALEAAQAKSAFMANMSHEIRTPLNGIIGMTDLLLETPLDEVQKRYAKIVQDSGTGLLTIINDILDFSKIDAGKLNLEVLDFSPVTLVESQAELLANRAGEKGLSCITFVDPKLPEILKGDSGRIGQILLNLISNAIKFTERGRVYIEARSLGAQDGIELVNFSVEDTGIGLSPEQSSRLFKPFQQADGSTARKYGGTGLGLSICKQLVDLMKGSIEIESVLGQGTRVSFQIPLATAQIYPSVKDVSSERTSLHRLHILVIDDDPVAREVMSHYLNSWEMEVNEAPDAELGLQLMLEACRANHPYDLVISDNRMPGMDGLSLAKAVKNTPELEETPLILVTGYDRKALETTALAEGFSYFITKPVKQSVLYNGIVTALHKKTIEVVIENLAMSFPETPALDFRILVAEDNSVNQLLTLTQLKKLGYNALAVANGREVLEALETSHYDLILMDCQMPEMDGFEATRQIRANEAKTGEKPIPIIALTANVMKEDKDSCEAAGMSDFVSKPTKKEILAAALKKWLQPITAENN